VHALPSLQTTGSVVHPVSGLHESVVQALPSLQTTGVVVHPVSGLHESVVQALPSLQTTGSFVHPVAGSQESVVQALPSSQDAGVQSAQSALVNWPTSDFSQPFADLQVAVYSPTQSLGSVSFLVIQCTPDINRVPPQLQLTPPFFIISSDVGIS
jgi:hypothetical protein